MKYRRVDFAAAAQAAQAPVSIFELTLNGLRPSLAVQACFNALAAVSLTLLGHPVLAAATFATYCGIDFVHNRIVRRWLARLGQIEDRKGFSWLALLCAARFTIYLAPTLAAALIGGAGELALLGVQGATLLGLGLQTGSMSRRVFWAFVTPVLGAFALDAVVKLGPTAAGAVLISLAGLAAILAVLLEGTYRTVCVLHGAYNQNVAMIPQLEAARDQAVAERAAADDAREEARQASRAKANFLATMSHEIRTPMNGVLGMAQLLQRDEADPAQKERLAVLIDSGEYLLSILNDILDVSKIDAGRLDIVPAAEDMALFLERLVGFWGPRADEKGVSLVLDVKPEVPAFVLVDALRLRQVLFNLVGNALKFTDEGSVTVVAEAVPNGEGAVLLHLAVRDTGIGISAENLPQLFTRFTQGDESEVRKFGGTGLGLAIAKQLVELMAGKIWAESEIGKGSTFHLKLPLALAHGPATPKAANTTDDSEPVSSLQVLAVDDNAINLMVLDQLLSSFGHTIVKAASGAEALAMLAERPFDLVLLDIQMPGMTGIEVLQRLRAVEGPNRAAPVVALTADVTSGGRRRYLELGFTEHSPKPLQIADLMESIARAVAAGPTRRAAA
jgi:signal transduction histidine kinase/CheY-like chemotaxis protein